jgi:hypothetical protein
MKYLRHFPLAFWAAVFLLVGGLLAYAQIADTPSGPTRVTSASPPEERGNVMALLARLATVHAAAAPPASGLAQWGMDTASAAQALADRRAEFRDDHIVFAYRNVAAAAAGLATLDPMNREQILAGISALGAAGNQLGAAVTMIELPVVNGSPGSPRGSATSPPSESIAAPQGDIPSSPSTTIGGQI